MSSKLIHSQKPFFSKMVVDAVMCLDRDDLNEALIGVKKVPGGAMQVSTALVLERDILGHQVARGMQLAYRSRRS